MGGERAHPYQIEVAAQVFRKASIQHNRVDLEYLPNSFDRIGISVGGDGVGEREACAKPTQDPTEAAGVVKDPGNVPDGPLRRRESMMNQPKGTRADFEIVGVA